MIAINIRQQLLTFSDSINTRTFMEGSWNLEILPPSGDVTDWRLAVDCGDASTYPNRKFDLHGTETDVQSAHDAIVEYLRAHFANDVDAISLWDVGHFGSSGGWQSASLSYPKA